MSKGTILTEDNSIFMDIARLRVFCHNQFLSDTDITATQALVLLTVSQQEGSTQGELARMLGIRAVTLGGIVDRMETKHWLERRPDQEDRRAKRIWLRDPGRSQVKDVQASIRKVNDIAMQGIDERRFDEALNVLNSIKNNLLAFQAEADK